MFPVLLGFDDDDIFLLYLHALIQSKRKPHIEFRLLFSVQSHDTYSTITNSILPTPRPRTLNDSILTHLLKRCGTKKFVVFVPNT